MDYLELAKKAGTMGEDHGYIHARFCDAYGWAEHEATIPMAHGSPRTLLRYLLAGTPIEATPAEYDLTALNLLGEYISGFVDGIERYEDEHLDS